MVLGTHSCNNDNKRPGSNTTYSVALLGAGNDNVPPTAVVPDSVIIQQVAAGNGTTTFELLNEGDEDIDV